jgi:hypothetical protein
MSAVVCSTPLLPLVAALVVLVVLGGLVAWVWCWVLTPFISSALEPRVESEPSRIYREQQAAITDITAIRREAERQMREIAREDPGEVIDSTALELPVKRLRAAYRKS